ncbi:MAG TPA: methyltransferase domain-containing protein [Candidatus Binataceae bacterium]
MSRSQIGPVEIIAAKPRGRLLDVPAGHGLESTRLRELGFRVASADLFPQPDRDRAIGWVQADANEPLPFRGAAFDYILSREGIEHLENQAGFIRECARVIRPSGTIVITTPNVMHVGSRLSYFLTFHRTVRRGLMNEAQTLRSAYGSRYYHGHIFLIDYFRLRYLLRICGFGEIAVFSDSISPTSIGLAWCVPAMWIASKFSIAMSRRKARKYGQVVPNDVIGEMMRHVFSPALLLGKRLIVSARKLS